MGRARLALGRVEKADCGRDRRTSASASASTGPGRPQRARLFFCHLRAFAHTSCSCHAPRGTVRGGEQGRPPTALCRQRDASCGAAAGRSHAPYLRPRARIWCQRSSHVSHRVCPGVHGNGADTTGACRHTTSECNSDAWQSTNTHGHAHTRAHTRARARTHIHTLTLGHGRSTPRAGGTGHSRTKMGPLGPTSGQRQSSVIKELEAEAVVDFVVLRWGQGAAGRGRKG